MKTWEIWREKFLASRRDAVQEAFQKGFSRDENSDANKQGQNQVTEKEMLDVSAPWAQFLRHAANSSKAPVLARYAEGNVPPLGDELLNAALRKAVKSLRQQTPSLEEDSIQQELLSRLAQDRVARKSALSTVRFLHGAQSAWFTECSFCGHDNDPPWDVCAKCANPREEE